MIDLSKQSVCIFGGSGALGRELIPLFFEKGAAVYCPTHSEVDITCFGSVLKYLKKYKPDIVINCAAHTNVTPDDDVETAVPNFHTNTIGAWSVLLATQLLYNCKSVYISTDYVYPGVSGNYKPGMEAPATLYGYSKYLGESNSVGPYDLIIRTSFKTRDSWGGEKGYQKVYHPVKTNADWVDVIAPKIVQAIEEGRRNIVQIGTTPKFLSDLAKECCETVEVVTPPKWYPKDCTMVLDTD